MIQYEYRKTVKRKGEPILEPEVQSMESHDGYNFRSVYGYPDDTSKFIVDKGNTRGLTNKVVYSDVLLIDADTEKETEKVLEILKSLGIQFKTYHTGHRGGHFHIPIIPMEGDTVVYSQRQWLKQKGLWEFVDTSIYREGGQYRLIGAKHRKTGLEKVETDSFDGELLEIPVIKRPPITEERPVIGEGTVESKIEYITNLLVQRSEGSRHMHFYILWRRGLESGRYPEDVKEDIKWYNEVMCDPPHPEHVVESKLGGFK